jgi:hypothetical protein
MLFCETHPNEVPLFRRDTGKANRFQRKFKKAVAMCPAKKYALESQISRQRSRVDKQLATKRAEDEA